MFSLWKTLGKRLTLRSREQTPNQPRKSSPLQNKNCKPLTCKWPLQITPVNIPPTNTPCKASPLRNRNCTAVWEQATVFDKERFQQINQQKPFRGGSISRISLIAGNFNIINNPFAASLSLYCPYRHRKHFRSLCYALNCSRRTFSCWKKLTHGVVVYLRSKTNRRFESVVQSRCYSEEQWGMSINKQHITMNDISQAYILSTLMPFRISFISFIRSSLYFICFTWKMRWNNERWCHNER